MTDSAAPDQDASDQDAPDTIVLVHGLWMTPRSWGDWKARFEARGFTVLTPGYPGFEIEVEALRENPDLIANLTVPDTVDHIAAQIDALPEAADHHGPLVRRHAHAAAARARASAPPPWWSTRRRPRGCASTRSRR